MSIFCDKLLVIGIGEEGGGRGEAKLSEHSRLDPFQDVFASQGQPKKMMDGMTEDKNKVKSSLNLDRERSLEV